MKKILFSAVTIFSLFTAKAQWIPQHPGFTRDTFGFYEMSLPDKNTVWAVCYDGKSPGLLSTRSILSFTRTVDAGATWIPGKVNTDQHLRFSNISAIDGQEAWVAMHKVGPVPSNYYGSFGKGGGVFHTIDGGVTWEHTEPGELFNDNSVPRFVHFKDKNHGVAMGDPNGGYFEIYTTNNKGKKWKRVSQEKIPAPLGKEIGWISGYAVVGNTIWFGTDSGRMYKSIDFGKTWTVNRLDSLLGAYVHEIAFLDDGLTGVAHLRNATRTFVFSTTDGGLTWTNYFQPPNWKNSRLTAVPGTHAFVSTSVHPNPLFTGSSVSYDAGKTWAHIDQTAQKAVSRFFDATTGYAGGFYVSGHPVLSSRGIFKSTIQFELPIAPTVSNSSSTPSGTLPTKMESDATLKVYPTPARDIINITLQNPSSSTIQSLSLLSMDGKIMQARRITGSSVEQLDVSKIPAGVYMLQVRMNNNQVINKIITIAR
jgi:photosystem II stability/assembly factor-like uncharacterized protein